MGGRGPRDKVDFRANRATSGGMESTGIPFPDLSPVIFAIEIGSFEFALRWYALAYIVGLLIGWRIVVAAVKRPHLWPGARSPMTPEQVEDLLTAVILGVIVGGRLGFVLFYQPAYYLANPIDILKIWQGGMAFHGGLLGVIFAVWWTCRKHGAPLANITDAVALSVPPALFLGRVANFINAELWGRPTDLPWGVIFPGEAAQNCPGVTGPCACHPSQLYEAGLEGLILGLLLFFVVYRRGWFQTPWAVTGLFMAGYGTGRFVVEFFRQPDADFQSPTNPLGYALQLGDYGLTMGQILSLPMIVIGLSLVLWARRRGAAQAA